MRTAPWFSQRLLEAAPSHPGLLPGRITACHGSSWQVAGEEGSFLGEVAGKLTREREGSLALPLTGDEVLFAPGEGGGAVRIEEILPRTSLFHRRGGEGEGRQGIAANLDRVFLCMACNRDFSLRRLERYLALAYDSGAEPLVVLTKTDLAEDLPALIREVEGVAPGVPILETSAFAPESWRLLEEALKPGMTGALLGSSGVGKSTLLNCLLGEEVMATGAIREDGRGRHTTSVRELFFLPGRKALLDTPGLRALGMDGVDLDQVFQEIHELGRQCRYRDCSHQGEPGCAVEKALAEGRLSRERLESYLKLLQEEAYLNLDSREILRKKQERMYRDFQGKRNARKFVKGKGKVHE